MSAQPVKAGSSSVAVLSSLWDSLNPNLLAEFFEVRKTADASGAKAAVWGRVQDGPSVRAPLVESSLEASLGWASPFEQSGLESAAPMLLSMVQSGALQPTLDSAGGLMVKGLGMISQSWANNLNSFMDRSKNYAKGFEGKSGITKLNSTQVFTGMAPVKIQVKALFRAWKDPATEVETPVGQLWAWALPQFIAPESTLASRLMDSMSREESLDILLPSTIPVHIGMTYKRRTYQPLVIESIDLPIGGPITKDGHPTEMAVSMTLCSLTAWDKNDWAQQVSAK